MSDLLGNGRISTMILQRMPLVNSAAWHDYLKSIQIQIGKLGVRAEIYRESVREWETDAVGDTPAAEEVKKEVGWTQKQLREMTDVMSELQELFKKMKNDFGKPIQHVIGQIVWLPAITVSPTLHCFTKDICIVKLNKARFFH
jgi:hypothetical protein